MKKLLLVLAVLFTTVSSSFAYQSYTLYPTDPSGQWGGAQVNLNGYYNYVGLQSYFTPGQQYGGTAVAYESGGQSTLIGEHNFQPGYSSNTNTTTVYSSQYWGTVQMYMHNGTGSYAYATLFWGN